MNLASLRHKCWQKGVVPLQSILLRLLKVGGVFVHEPKELVAMLMQVDLDDHVPPELYQAIAEILAWLHRLETDENRR
jgi:flagellar biosynthesis protein